MKERQYSKIITNEIDKYLKNIGLNYSFNENNGVFYFTLSIREKFRDLEYTIIIGENYYTVYTTPSVSITQNMITKIIEFICKVNNHLNCNSYFLFDFENRDIICKYHCDCEKNTILTKDIIEKSIFEPSRVILYWGNPLLQIVYNNTTVDKAMSSIQ